MQSKPGNIEIMINDEALEVIKERFDSFQNGFKNDLISVKGSEFFFYYAHLLYYECYKLNPNRGESC